MAFKEVIWKQSSNSAEEIKKIVEQLVADSESSVEVMQRLNTSFEQQSQQIASNMTETISYFKP